MELHLKHHHVILESTGHPWIHENWEIEGKFMIYRQEKNY